jgi:hypothetical protein
MSRLSEKIEARPTQRHLLKKAKLAPVMAYSENRLPSTSVCRQIEYRIGVQLQVQCRVDEPDHDAKLIRAKDLAKANIIEEVFGEFRQPLIRARMELECGDSDVALELIKGVYDDMFDGQ